jgi:hypothetical protein
MVSSSGKYVVTGALAITYGVILCIFWLQVLWGSGENLLQETWTAGDVLAVLLFASVPVMLVAAACLLRRFPQSLSS